MITRLPSIALVHEPSTRVVHMILSESDISDVEISQVMTKVLSGQIPKFRVADTFIDRIRNERFVVNLETNWKEV
jgi:hypothetical protein